MKVLLVTGIYPPDIGGPATYGKLLHDRLPEHGIEVEVLSFGSVRKYSKFLRHIIFLYKTVKVARNVDAIFSQDLVSAGVSAAITAVAFKKPFLVRVPGDYAWEQSTQRFGVTDTVDDFQKKTYGFKIELLRRLQKFTVNRADAVMAPSVYFKNIVATWLKDPSKAHAVYNGIDVSQIPKTSTIEPKTIISAGRLVNWKGFVALIEMMIELPGWKLTIAGEGPERQNLEKLIADNKLENSVTLLGQIDRNLLFEKMAASEVFVLNSYFETFSYQVVEAMHIGVPIVVTNVGNLSEIITNRKTGILVTPNDIAGIRKAILEIHTDKDLKEILIREAQEKSKAFSIEATIKNVAMILKRIAPQK